MRPDDWIFWQPTRNIEDGALVPYLAQPFSPDVYRCPSDDVESHARNNPNYNYSYSVNWNICQHAQRINSSPPPTGYGPILKYVQIVQPEYKILAVEENSMTIDDGCWAPEGYTAGSGSENLLSNRHDRHGERDSVTPDQDKNAGRGNVIFADGHVDFIDRWLTTWPFYVDPHVHEGGKDYWGRPWNIPYGQPVP
jgi:prepilin-type processing-associated H-X9-DG protein